MIPRSACITARIVFGPPAAAAPETAAHSATATAKHFVTLTPFPPIEPAWRQHAGAPPTAQRSPGMTSAETSAPAPVENPPHPRNKPDRRKTGLLQDPPGSDIFRMRKGP